jgi:hypothetical protein
MNVRTVTPAEVETVKSDLKKMGLKVTVQTIAPVKRVQGSITIKSRKRGDSWSFTMEEIAKVRSYLLANGFVGGSIEDKSYVDLCFHPGFFSLFKSA